MPNAGDSTTNVDEPPPSKRMRVDSQAQAGDGGLEFLLRTKRKPTECKFERYLQSSPPDAASPLDYWKQPQSEYTRCVALALKFLSIPATSVQSERLFSASGRVITKSRSAAHVSFPIMWSRWSF